MGSMVCTEEKTEEAPLKETAESKELDALEKERLRKEKAKAARGKKKEKSRPIWGNALDIPIPEGFQRNECEQGDVRFKLVIKKTDEMDLAAHNGPYFSGNLYAASHPKIGHLVDTPIVFMSNKATYHGGAMLILKRYHDDLEEVYKHHPGRIDYEVTPTSIKYRAHEDHRGELDENEPFHWFLTYVLIKKLRFKGKEVDHFGPINCGEHDVTMSMSVMDDNLKPVHHKAKCKCTIS